jgi:hypothetical protein
MTPRSAFQLKVWHQKDDEFCSFLLLWDGGNKNIYVSLNYPKKLQKWYQRWQQRYFRFYEFPPPQTIGDSGSVNPGSGDPCNALREAEQNLIQEFQKWLGEGEVRKIQEQIRDEFTRIVQTSSKQEKRAGSHPGIDIFLTCNSDELARLPWETWQLAPERMPLGTVRIARTLGNSADISAVKRPLRRRRTRILALIGNDPKLPLHEDWKVLRSSLKSIADVHRVQWQPEDDVVQIKNKIAADISDRQGWDVLFFTGHSDETCTGGRLAIASNLSLSISELEDYLIEARENGLQLAVFNSCSGLPIATKLVELGMQVVVMREPIPDKAAQIFLKHFCQQLAARKDAHDALQHACNYLQFNEQFACPSTHLIPSFFSPARTVPFRIPSRWEQWQQWLPNRQEAIALFTILLFSSMFPVQNWLLDCRTFMQLLYRDTTKQLPHKVLPPVLLVAIDQESINRAIEEMEGFRVKPIDRRYLAQLVRRLSDLNAKVIGIDYLLDTQEPGTEKLAESLQFTLQQQETWFVFAIKEQDRWKVTKKIASSNWSLQGDMYLWNEAVELPTDATCTKPCPFAYLLALAHTLNQQPPQANVPKPNWYSPVDFQQQVSRYLNQAKGQDRIIAPLKRTYSPFGLRSIIDFSIPPDRAYKRIPAWDFLNLTVPNPELQQAIEQQVVIIAAGGYTDYTDIEADNFPVPLAVKYWCHSRHWQAQKKADCPRVFTGGETHAYMVHHLLLSHRVVLIPDFWMILIAAFLGKGTTLALLKQKHQQRQRRALVLVGATTAFGFVELQLYISAGVSIPWFFPSILFWAYIFPVLRQK